MTGLPTVTAVVTITNPVQSGYYVFLASIKSLAVMVDEVIVVDGGSTDGSLELLRNWLGSMGNVRIVSGPQFQWGKRDLFHVHQINVSYDVVFREVRTDWVLPMPADQVAWGWDSDRIRRELQRANDAVYASFFRSKTVGGKLLKRLDSRGIALNLSRARALNLHVCWGESADGRVRDFPIAASRKSAYRDPFNASERVIYSGAELHRDVTFDFECGTYGHFFLTEEQCVHKSRRWDIVAARYYGSAPTRIPEIRSRQGLYQPARRATREEVLTWDFPPEMKEVVAAFYTEGMIGGRIRASSAPADGLIRAASAVAAAERQFRRALLRASGYRGLQEQHVWVPLSGDTPAPLDVRACYAEQDTHLPKWARLPESNSST